MDVWVRQDGNSLKAHGRPIIMAAYLLWAALSPISPECRGSAQELPSAPSIPWLPSQNLHLPKPEEAPALRLPDATEPLSLAALINLAEERNPQTQAAWQQARQAAAQKGIAKAALFPLLTGLVISQTLKEEVLFGDSFVRQTVGDLDPTMQLDYILFDANARLDSLRAARYQLFATNFAFNAVHLALIRQVAGSYYALLNNQGQVAAAQINLENARAITAQEDARLAQGLATLPDALEARAAAAQAAYELASLQGARTNAQANLATTLRLSAQTVLPVVPLDRLAPPAVLSATAVQAIAQALEDRPDLLENEAQVAAAAQLVRRARAAYYPQLRFSGQYGFIRIFGNQVPSTPASSGVYASLARYNAQLDLSWAIFDGGRRRNELRNAEAGKFLADARLNQARDEVEDQVWTSYTNLQTAFAQQESAQALLGAAEISYAAATEALANGVRTLVDVITAQRTLAQARSEEVSARTNLFIQATELAFRTGTLLSSHTGPALLPPPPAPGNTPALPSNGSPP